MMLNPAIIYGTLYFERGYLSAIHWPHFDRWSFSQNDLPSGQLVQIKYLVHYYNISFDLLYVLYVLLYLINVLYGFFNLLPFDSVFVIMTP